MKTTKRKPGQLRSTTIEPYETMAAASVVIAAGATRVLCTASIASDPPKWLPRDDAGEYTKGWVTAEYNMLPGSTPDRKRRGPDGRGTEIQRLIARVLRASVNLEKMPGLLITCDCDVLSADGGTRTASITGAYVALAQAIGVARGEGMIKHNPIERHVAAVSVGIIDGKAYLDLDYPLDSRAEVDMNVAMTNKGEYVEIQGTAERGVFTREQQDELLDLAGRGVRQLVKIQREAIGRD